jgi:hypothetical protein
MPDFEPTAIHAIETLRARFPHAPFLTLGQTVLWDEPVKAAFCRLMEQIAPDATIVAAVHDTDYFAKLPNVKKCAEKFVMVPHNDGSTRGLWSAAGELSCLFGSETVPTRHLLTENGVAFDRVARDFPGGVEALLDEETEAWGWRALVHTEPRPLIAADVKLRDIAPALRQQLQWGFNESLAILQCDARNTDACDSAQMAQQISRWVEEYIESDPDGTLSDLYRALTPRLWAMVRGEGSCNLQTGASLQLFRFNRSTAKLPRFRFVDLFLQPATRELARRCYDEALCGSGIYTLEQFGAGALPFDVVIPGRGRGTLRLQEGSLYIETEEPITLCAGCDCGSVEELADVLEQMFPDGAALVGKAVALISMAASEFIFVFHEHASGYTERTQVMNNALRAAGVELDLHPILRVKYSTWGALRDISATFRLPPHLAAAFGCEIVEARDFAMRWEEVCNAQDALRSALKTCHSPRELLALLAERQRNDLASSNATQNDWAQKLDEYGQARAVIKALRQQTQVLEGKINKLREETHRAKDQADLERAKSRHFHTYVQPLRERIFDIKEAAFKRRTTTGKLSREEKREEERRQEEERLEVEALRARLEERLKERAHFDEDIAAQRERARELQIQTRANIDARVALERSDEAITARATIARIEYEAELERLRLTRNAILTSRGLRHINYRPTAWWFPLVSPDGRWFNSLVQTMQARLEEL